MTRAFGRLTDAALSCTARRRGCLKPRMFAARRLPRLDWSARWRCQLQRLVRRRLSDVSVTGASETRRRTARLRELVYSSGRSRDSRGTAHCLPLSLRYGSRNTRTRSCGELNARALSGRAACSSLAFLKTAVSWSSGISGLTRRASRRLHRSTSSELQLRAMNWPSLVGAIAADEVPEQEITKTIIKNGAA